MAPDLFWKCSCGHTEDLVVTCPICGESTHPEKEEKPEEALRDIFIHLKKVDKRLQDLEEYVSTHRFCKGIVP